MKNNAYILELTHQEKKNIGFKYDFALEEYVYEFPVYKSNNKSSIICKLFINEETNEVCVGVYDLSGRPYSSYYNRRYGKSKIVPIIDRNIKKEILKIGAKESR